MTTTMALMTMTAIMMATTVMPTTMATMLARRPSAARTQTANAMTLRYFSQRLQPPATRRGCSRPSPWGEAFADLIHLPDLINRYGPLPTAWSLERKHKIIKKYGNHLFSHSAPSRSGSWDKSVLRDVSCERLYSIADDEFDLHASLLSPTKTPSRQLLTLLRETFGVSSVWADSVGFKLSRHARLSEISRASVGDAVVFACDDGTYSMGSVQQLLEVTTSPPAAEPTLLALVAKWTQRRMDKCSSVWETQSLGSQYMRLQAILRPATCWSHRSADRCVVVHPPGLGFDA